MLRLLSSLAAISVFAALSGCSNNVETASPAAQTDSTTATAASSSESPTSTPEIAEAASSSDSAGPEVSFKLPGDTGSDAQPTEAAIPSIEKSASPATTAPKSTSTTVTGASKGQNVQPAEMVVFFPPFYPLSLRMEGIEGRIDLGVTIDPNGDVQDVQVLAATAPQFRDYAVAAAKEWKFHPAKVDGKPVGVRVTFPIPFISEFGSGDLSPRSPLARLTYIDGTYYTAGADGRLQPANTEVTPLLRATPAFAQPEGDTKTYRVVLNFTVSEEGQVLDPKVVESSGTDFDAAALTAVKYWRFVPSIKKGKAMSSKVSLPMIYGGDSKDHAAGN